MSKGRDLGRGSWRRGAGWLLPGALLGGSLLVGALPVVATAAHPAASRAKIVRVVDAAKRGHFGAVLVTTKGMTLYHYTLDKKGKVACTGKCATIWPPLLLATGERPAGGPGVTGLGTVRDPDGKVQVTWHGEPLYVFSGDKKPGQTNGEGFLGKWYVVSTSAKKPAATSSGSGSGY
jgi:predicted lipoprotein with Yx(FWY)xxD motif